MTHGEDIGLPPKAPVPLSPRSRWTFALAMAACVTAYLAFAALAHAYRYLAWDPPVIHALQGARNPAFDALLKAVSWTGYFPQFVPFFGLVAGALYALKLKIEALAMAAGEAGVAVMGFVAKPLVGRHRPPRSSFWVNDTIKEDPYSFTAGHVHTYAVIFGFVIYLALTRLPKGSPWRWPVVGGSALFLVLLGVSRAYLGDHWPSDVIAGYFTGGAWLGAAILMERWGRARRARKAAKA